MAINIVMDRFEYSPQRLSQPITRASAIVPNDANDIETSRALYIGAGGTLVVVLAGNASEVTFTNVPDGSVLPFRVKAVKTASTATGIVALY